MAEFEPIPPDTETVSAAIVDAAINVHMSLGPGLLESVYESCLCHELHKRGLQFQRQLDLPTLYDSIRLESGLRIDILAADCVIVEVACS
jgi:GxxExxY protein